MKNTICKDDKILFDMLFDAYVKKDVTAGMKVQAAIHSFMNKPILKARKQIQALKKIQAVGVSTDFDQITTNAFNVTVEEDNFDLGYEAVFKNVPIDPGKDYWEVYNVEKGITFRKIEEGERLRVEGMSGDVEQVYVDYYGGALGYTDRMIRFRKVAAMVDKASMFRNAYWTNKANNFYLLLAVAAAGNVTGYQGAAADGELQQDIQTINAAAFALADRCKHKGFGDTASMEMILYANPNDKDRINAAFRATTTAMAAAGLTGRVVDWNIRVIYTFNSNISSGSPLLILPGNKIQTASVMEPTNFVAPQDVLTLNHVQAVWSIYGATIGDTDQCQQLTLS